MKSIDYKPNRKTFIMRTDEELSKLIVMLSMAYKTTESSAIAILIKKEITKLNYKGEKNE
ncbi:hypothetical protein [Cupriavidus sp. H19C3]|jgi:hypothetical protein|uniref:hypothetical protein n=1 Tax=Cupriavidus sp. H19C3 TaxID=3241603 RepID=UPI00293690B4|nr:hypothetical protein [Raoultella ornithinolytica]